MTAVVTGAGGFCGQAMSSYLKSLGVAVIALNREDFYDELGTLPSVPKLARVFERNSIDAIFHFAGTSHTRDDAALQIANVMTTAAIFEALTCVLQKPIVVLVGSAAEYGRVKRADLPLDEVRRENPTEGYGLSKAMQTSVGRLASACGHRVILSRPFNIIGPGMPGRLAVGNFLSQIAAQATSHEAVLETGNLEASRDFVLIDDAVRAWWELTQKTEAFGRVINVCSGVPIRLRQIVAWMLRASPRPFVVKSQPAARPEESLEHFGSAQRLQSLLGWTPRVLTEESVGAVVTKHLAAHANSDNHRAGF